MGAELLPRAWQDLGGDPRWLARARVIGQADLPSALPVARFAVDAVAVQLLAAAELAVHEQDGGHDGDDVVIDAAHVGVSFRSERLLRVAGRPAGAAFAPLSRFVPAADGWVRLHANYPHHAAALHAALGTDPRRAIGAQDRFAVEEAVTTAGGIAAAVRTPAEWAAHAAAAAVDAGPLLDLHRAPGSGSTGPTTARRWRPRAAPRSDGSVGRRPSSGPPTGLLAGLRVLDLTRVIAGPVATRTLASYGAEVLRVDSPHLPEDEATLLETGGGKRWTALDLTQRADRRRFDELLAGADVLVHGYRPGALDRHGLAEDTLAVEHPALVVASLSAWGTGGPWGQRRGFDSIVQAATGIAYLTRSTRASGGGAGHDWVPGALPVQALDHGAGHLLAAAVLRALSSRGRDGGTWHARLSLAGVAHHLLTLPRRSSAGAAGATPVVDGSYLMDLPSDSGALSVVTPPGSPPWICGPRYAAPADASWEAVPPG